MQTNCRLMLVLALFLSLAATLLPAVEDSTSTKKIKVALYIDRGAKPRGNLLKALKTAPDMSLTVIDGEDLREGYLNAFDVLLVPGGSAKRESFSMGEKGREEVRRFVANGGLYLGICAGCYLLTASKPAYLGLLPLDTLDKQHWARGKGILPVELTPLGNEIFGTNQKIFEVLYHNGPVIDTSHLTTEANFMPLGYYRHELVKKGGQKGLMNGSPAMFLGRFGKGRVIGISPHPEAKRSQVEMELNAIRWLYAHRTKA